jgi:hypothetical protein
MRGILSVILIIIIITPSVYSQKGLHRDSSKVYYFYYSFKIEDSLHSIYGNQYRPLAVWISNDTVSQYHIYTFRSCLPLKMMSSGIEYLGYGIVNDVIIKREIVYIKCEVFKKFTDFKEK